MTVLNEQASKTQQALFGMGCFWGPDSFFGSLKGVIETAVGFAGGTTDQPVYRNIGDHTESILLTFDPAVISYEELVRLFWQQHDAMKDRFYKERHYISLLIYFNNEQKEIAEKIKAEQEAAQEKKIQTEFQAYSIFYAAENYHQKYFLRRFKTATNQLKQLFSDDEDAFIHSTIAARLNGFVREKTTLQAIKDEIPDWGLEHEKMILLDQTLQTIRW